MGEELSLGGYPVKPSYGELEAALAEAQTEIARLMAIALGLLDEMAEGPYDASALEETRRSILDTQAREEPIGPDNDPGVTQQSNPPQWKPRWDTQAREEGGK